MSSSSDAARNREVWTRSNAEHTDAKAREAWSADEISWGIWSVPESQVRVLPELEGKDVVELGCGTGYVSAWLARRGARPSASTSHRPSWTTARALQQEFGLEFPLIEADAAETGLPDASADLVVSEYGASIWVDPYRWIPEAARLLRPGGELVFLCNSTLVILCSPDGDEPAGERLVRGPVRPPPAGLLGRRRVPPRPRRLVRLLRANGFELLDLVEIQAPPEADDARVLRLRHGGLGPAAGPSEELWRARKR